MVDLASRRGTRRKRRLDVFYQSRKANCECCTYAFCAIDRDATAVGRDDCIDD